MMEPNRTLEEMSNIIRTEMTTLPGDKTSENVENHSPAMELGEEIQVAPTEKLPQARILRLVFCPEHAYVLRLHANLARGHSTQHMYVPNQLQKFKTEQLGSRQHDQSTHERENSEMASLGQHGADNSWDVTMMERV